MSRWTVLSPSYAAKRGRTLMGVKDDGTLVIYVCGDDTLHSLTAVQCRQKMLELGCKYAIMLDGGGSSQCDFATGDYIRSTRAVCDYLCIWEKEPEPEVEYKNLLSGAGRRLLQEGECGELSQDYGRDGL